MNAVAVKPAWLRKPAADSPAKRGVIVLLKEKGLATVCREARCPNKSECFGEGTAAFLILGTICSRACAFCAVDKGAPRPADRTEPERVAETAEAMGLSHVVVTSVTRDDLPDGGAAHFAATVQAVRRRTPLATVEVLTPDFRGDTAALRTVLAARPDVFNHNLETVPRLYGARPGASFDRSLSLLAAARAIDPGVLVKTGLLLGMGETGDEVRAVMTAAAAAGVGLMTLGQYLPPSRSHWPVAEYVSPAAFE